MKIEKILSGKISLLFLILVFISKIAVSQIDTTAKAKQDTTAKAMLDTIATAKQDTTKPAEKKKKKSSGFIAYGAVTFSKLNMTSGDYTSTSTAGWALGLAYRKGDFFYWQVGARYNNAIYKINVPGQAPTANNSVTVTDIDIPINVGINILSITQRFMGLRVFVGAVPAFLIGVGNSDYSNLTKSNANSFNMYGQGGIGLDVLFLSIDAGYNYGFSDVFKTAESKPGQVFVNLGFRF